MNFPHYVIACDAMHSIEHIREYFQ